MFENKRSAVTGENWEFYPTASCFDLRFFGLPESPCGPMLLTRFLSDVIRWLTLTELCALDMKLSKDLTKSASTWPHPKDERSDHRLSVVYEVLALIRFFIDMCLLACLEQRQWSIFYPQIIVSCRRHCTTADSTKLGMHEAFTHHITASPDSSSPYSLKNKLL